MWRGCLFVVKHLILIAWFILVLLVKLTFWVTIGFLIGAFLPRKIK